MTGLDLLQNFHSDPESLLRRTRARLVSPRRPLSAAEPVIASSSASQAIFQKTLHDYSAPSANHIPTGPEVNTRGENFEIRTGLIMIVQASPFWGKANEDIYQCSSPTVLGALQHFCYLGCISRCNLAPFVPVLSSGESEAMVLC